MGHCNECGAACPHCIGASDFTFLRLAEPIRGKVKRLLSEVGATTNERVNRFIGMVSQYEEATIMRTFRVWDAGGYANTGKDERYFLGILRSAAVSKPIKLESLPPFIEYHDEGDEP